MIDLDETLPAKMAMFDRLPVGVADFGPNGEWRFTNRHLHELLGYPSGSALPTLDELTHPEDRDVDRINVELATTGAVDAYRQQRRLRRADGVFLWVDTSVSALRHGDGTLDRLTAVVQDISRAKAVEHRRQTVLAELAHRGRNLFALLQALARHSLTADRSVSEAHGAFQGRLRALYESLNTLMDQNFQGSRLDLMLRRMSGYWDARAFVDGPAVTVTPNAGQTFALLLHELATNATKHGAWSTAEGQVAVSWRVFGSGDAARFTFDWRETGGPPAMPPQRRGFGTTLTHEVVGADFDCIPEATYGAAGFAYRFDAPLARVGALVLDAPVRHRLKNSIVRALYDEWVREKAATSGLPTFVGFEWARFAAAGAMTLGKVQPDGSVRLTQVGRALVDRLGHPFSEDQLAGEDLDRLRAAYQRCAHRAAPCHEALRMGFEPEESVVFERLLVPFADTPGGAVAYVIGIAILTGATRDQRGSQTVTSQDAVN